MLAPGVRVKPVLEAAIVRGCSVGAPGSPTAGGPATTMLW